MTIVVYPTPPAQLAAGTNIVGQITESQASPLLPMLMALLVELRLHSQLMREGFCSEEDLDRLRNEPDLTTTP